MSIFTRVKKTPKDVRKTALEAAITGLSGKQKVRAQTRLDRINGVKVTRPPGSSNTTPISGNSSPGNSAGKGNPNHANTNTPRNSWTPEAPNSTDTSLYRKMMPHREKQGKTAVPMMKRETKIDRSAKPGVGMPGIHPDQHPDRKRQ